MPELPAILLTAHSFEELVSRAAEEIGVYGEVWPLGGGIIGMITKISAGAGWR